jgi:hypothetical protein
MDEREKHNRSNSPEHKVGQGFVEMTLITRMTLVMVGWHVLRAVFFIFLLLPVGLREWRRQWLSK